MVLLLCVESRASSPDGSPSVEPQLLSLKTTIHLLTLSQLTNIQIGDSGGDSQSRRLYRRSDNRKVCQPGILQERAGAFEKRSKHAIRLHTIYGDEKEGTDYEICWYGAPSQPESARFTSSVILCLR